MAPTYPASPDQVAAVRRSVRRAGEETTLDQEAIADLALAVSEACTNAIRHSGSSRFRVRIRVQRRGCMEVVVSDDGVFQGEPDGDAGLGLGIPIMERLAGRLDITPGTEDRPGTVVAISKCPESEPG